MAAEDPEKAMDVTDGSEEEDHDDDAGPDAKTLTSELLKNPAVMSALQGKLDSMVGTPSGYIKVNSSLLLKHYRSSHLRASYQHSCCEIFAGDRLLR